MLKKRGISPLIATVLLVGLAIIIIAIIIWWAWGFTGEAAEKQGALSEEQLKCSGVSIDVEKIEAEYIITNTGQQTIYGLIISDDIGSALAHYNVFATVAPTDIVTFTKGVADCSTGTAPPPLQFCSASAEIKMTPALQPQGLGRGAPLVPCSEKAIEFRVN